MSDINEVLSIARKEVSNTASYKNAQDFVNKCLGTDFTNCAESLRWYQRYNYVYKIPKVGDQIFINNSTGIVEAIFNDAVHIIEVDLDEESVFFGHVRRIERRFGEGIYGRSEYTNSELIVGLKSINDINQWLYDMGIFDDISAGIIKVAKMSVGCKPDCDFNSFIDMWNSVKRGHYGIQAQVVQVALIYLGYSCGEYGANGYFENKSVDAVKKFQKNNKMICDGIIGKAVATKLFKGISSSTEAK